MAGDKNKHTIWVLLFSLLAFTTTFQQNYHNNQVAVTPNEMVGLYCCDQPLNYLPIFLSGFSLVLGSSKERQFTWCQDLPSTRVFLPVSQEDPSSRNKYNPLHVNRIQQTYGAWMIRLLGSSSLHVHLSPLFNLSMDPHPPPPFPVLHHGYHVGGFCLTAYSAVYKNHFTVGSFVPQPFRRIQGFGLETLF